MFKISLLILIIFLFTSCEQKQHYEVRLIAQDRQADKGPRWSPYGQKMILTEKENGLETDLKLGENAKNQWRIRLMKSEESLYYNTLYIDQNQNGSFEDAEKITTVASESRAKVWSSFKTQVNITVTEPESGKEIQTIYPISLWYVFNPSEQAEEELLRFSRNGWLEGSVTIDGIEANILLTESTMDAKIDTADSWAIAPKSIPKELYDYRNNRSIKTHSWLNDKAFRIANVHPSGMKLTLEAFDPGMSRVEEAEALDIYASDKKAKRSGKSVKFLHDFEAALTQAKNENRTLFIDFETTWCGPCKIMDKLVYTADDVIEASKTMIRVKIDGDDFPELAKRFDVKGYPTLILLSPDEKIIDRRIGYQSVKQSVRFFKAELNR